MNRLSLLLPTGDARTRSRRVRDGRALPLVSLGMGLLLGVGSMTRAQDKPPMLSQSDATRIMQGFGNCLASQHPETAAVLATLPGSSEESVIISKASRPDCLDGDKASRLKFNAHALRGPIVEALLKRDFDVATGTPRKPAPARTYALPDAMTSAQQPRQTIAMIALIAFGECVQKGDPSGTLAVFRTKVESSQERAAIAAVQPALNKCLEAGGSFRMTPFEMRGYLAEGSYRNLASGNGHG